MITLFTAWKHTGRKKIETDKRIYCGSMRFGDSSTAHGSKFSSYQATILKALAQCISNIYTVNNYSPLQSLYRQMLCFLFVPAFDYKIYCLMLYHLLKSTLHLKANACSIGTFIRFYMQSSLHSKANACNKGTFIRFYIQMRVQIKNKAFAYRFYRPFTQQCT